MSSTIISQCTPSGSGAIALLRISGPDAFIIADKFLRLLKKEKVSDQASHSIHFAKAHIGEQIIDHAMALIMHAPKTFTGENVVEITCHNNPLIIEALVQEAIKYGARQALPGEFAQQAVLNKKIDFIQAESINELIGARTPEAINISLGQLQGSLSSKINSIQNQLLQALALCESSFEFLDDESISFDNQIMDILKQTNSEISKIKSSYDIQKQVRQGYRVTLLGSVNAGKSSLFNALIEEEKAIVTPVAGTTRDVIESTVVIDGQTITFVDTAGLRETTDLVESIGIKRSREEAIKSDLILLVRDYSEPEEQDYQNILKEFSNKIIQIQSQIDKTDIIKKDNIMPVSTVTNTGIEELKKHILERLANLKQSGETIFLLNKRHYHNLTAAQLHINKAIEMLEKNPAFELISISLNEAIQSLGQLTGQTVTHEVMDMIFRQFCVGK